MPDHNEQFFASFGSASAPVYGLLSNRHTTSGAAVKAWAKDLNYVGYTNNADVLGKWNAYLQTATENFQRDSGAKVDGLVGNETLAKMAAAKAAIAATGGFMASKDSIMETVRNLPSVPTPSAAPITSTPSAPSSSASGSAGEDQALAKVKTGVPFMETPLFEGGPSRGKALGFGALFLGSLGLIMGLITTRR
ncbi:MAG TPA: hypothetical protein EYF98_11530 [Planctomycetes bacterium]|nr:hypothetical protein [Planctomycetota bacterium]